MATVKKPTPAKQGPKPVPVRVTKKVNHSETPKRGTNKKLGV